VVERFIMRQPRNEETVDVWQRIGERAQGARTGLVSPSGTRGRGRGRHPRLGDRGGVLRVLPAQEGGVHGDLDHGDPGHDWTEGGHHHNGCDVIVDADSGRCC
jgi:hypothetical protein